MARTEASPSLLESLQDFLARSGPRPAASVLAHLGVSASTLSRALAADPLHRVVRLGKARATHYALRVPLREDGASWPLFVVDESGTPHEMAMLHRSSARAFIVETHARAPVWLSSPWGKGSWSVFDDVPWYLQDARAQGFLGRALLRRHAEQLQLPSDPRQCSTEHQLVLLLSVPAFAADLPGHLVVGADARDALAEPPSVRRADYPMLATSALAGEMVGSSAGGEQAKFTAFVDDGIGPARHVLVKFADRTSENGARFTDLLIAEHRAQSTLVAHGVPAVRNALLIDDHWCFLEVERFDRIGTRGRRATVSLEALDAELLGTEPRRWHKAAQALVERGLLDDEGAFFISVADAFGALIDNTDRHFGNVSFHIDDGGALTPTRVYDMLPMAYAPDVNGTRPWTSYAPMSAIDLSVFADDVRTLALGAATSFWHALADDGRVSDGMRKRAHDRAKAMSR